MKPILFLFTMLFAWVFVQSITIIDLKDRVSKLEVKCNLR